MKHSSTLCIFSPAFAKDENDTTWLPWLQSLVKNFNRYHPSVNIIIFSLNYPQTYKSYLWYNNLVIPFGGRSKTRFQRIFIWMRIFYKIYTIKKDTDIIGIFSLWCNETTFLAKWCSKFFNLKFRCWILGGDARPGNKYINRIHPEPKELVAMSEFLQEEFYRNYKIKPMYVIPNGIDPIAFSPYEGIKDIDILGAGSLSALKRYDLFIEVVKELRNTFPDIKAVLCGGGEKEVELKMLIEKYNLSKNIFLTGEIPHAETLLYMQRSKIFLHPSSYEGFSSVCLEALYAGAKVISFISPMNGSIKNWSIVKTKNEMTNKAEMLLKNDDEKYESVLIYSMQENTNKILNLFQSLN